MSKKLPFILAIESSCDETSAAILNGRKVLSNVIATQKIHEKYGGVVPELASRAHQSNILPVVHQAMTEASVAINDLDAIAVTRGPGLMGALLVGTSFAKSMSLSLNIPLIPVHHMKAHVMAHFVKNHENDPEPDFPFLCLTVSGGHTQIILVKSPVEMIVVGETIDDAAGEAFDKAAKVLGLKYPGGPLIDKYASKGDPLKFRFPVPRLEKYQYSFSGLKTSLLYFLRDERLKNESFISEEIENICASYQKTIVDYLLSNFEKAIVEFGVKDICLAGGVSANSELRMKFDSLAQRLNKRSFIPEFQYCTDNAAMIGVAAYFEFLEAPVTDFSWSPKANWKV